MAEKFHVGITMAGAVSAGAYTAGVIDYLFEVLHRWEDAKKNGEENIPNHEVQIDVIGGASAGGITAALTAFACFTGLDPVKDYKAASAPDYKPHNLLFNAWVNLIDEPGKTTFQKMLDTSDLAGKTVPSLLNSGFVDEIAKNAGESFLNHQDFSKNYPAFIARDLDVLLTLCSLRGIPIDVEFNSDNKTIMNPRHQMQTHKMFARFKMGQQQDNEEAFAFPMDKTAGSNLELLLECSKSTAAFPVGLAFRNIGRFNKAYIRKQFGEIMNIDEKYLTNIFHDHFADPFAFSSIDGGTLNNEPFSELAALMAKKRGATSQNVAMILIDPFPNFEDAAGDYKYSDSLENLFSPILGTLRHQSMLKEQDILTNSPRSTYKKNMIFPSRWEAGIKAKGNHIACGALGGFSGFIDRQFRVHDYFLGRHNCRNFLRNFFAIACPINNPKEWPTMFQKWDQAMIDLYKVPKESDTHYWLPIIPLVDFANQVKKEVQRRKVEQPGAADLRKVNFDLGSLSWKVPFPQIDAKDILELQKPIRKRLNTIIERVSDRMASSEETEISEEERNIKNYLEDKFQPGWWKKTTGFLVGGLIKRIAKKGIVSFATDFSLKYLLKSLNKSKLLRL